MAAVEQREQRHTAAVQLIQSQQEQVKTSQRQLKEECSRASLLREVLKERLLVKNYSSADADAKIPFWGSETDVLYLKDELKDLKTHIDKFEVSLRPLIKTKYLDDGEEDASPQVTTKEIPFTVTELAKLKKDFGRTARVGDRVCLESPFDCRDQITLTEKEAKGYWGPGVF